MLLADIPGACCFPDGSCDVYTNTVECGEDGGTFAGVGVTCDNARCPATKPECNEPLALSACPKTIVIETRDSEGVALDAAVLPTFEGCDVLLEVEPAIGKYLPIGENPINVMATDANGASVSCLYTIVIDLVDEVGPIRKRKIKGGGEPDGSSTGDGQCMEFLPGLGGSLCGACPLIGFMAAFAGLAAGRRRSQRRLRAFGNATCWTTARHLFT